MKLEDLKTIEQINHFLSGAQPVLFQINSVKEERYNWLRHELVRFDYTNLKRREKGIFIRYLMKVTNYSRQQITRLIKQYHDTGYIRHHHVTLSGFTTKYQNKDIRLLAHMDKTHDYPCGHTLKKLCERAYQVFGDSDYQQLSQLSVSHLYNLRKTTTYKRVATHFEKTKFKAANIATRKKPEPKGQPGYIRIDTVHQGDQDKQKGVYHINAVDEETQFEVVCSVEKISEQFLIPILKYMLNYFPFKILGFHSDNGSEYINRQVARLLQKLLIEFTKSRPRHSNDNALAESKNGSVVRKILGYHHIPQKYAKLVNEFNQTYLNPHINYHRPCFFPLTIINEKGKKQKTYPYELMMTPYEKLKSLHNAQNYLKDGLSFEIMDRIAYAMTDNQSANLLKQGRKQLFKTIDERELKIS